MKMKTKGKRVYQPVEGILYVHVGTFVSGTLRIHTIQYQFPSVTIWK